LLHLYANNSAPIQIIISGMTYWFDNTLSNLRLSIHGLARPHVKIFSQVITAIYLFNSISGCGPSIRPGVKEMLNRVKTASPTRFSGDPELVRKQLHEKYDPLLGCVGIGINKPVWSTTALAESAARVYAEGEYAEKCDNRTGEKLGYCRLCRLAIIDRWVNMEGTVFIDVVINYQDAPRPADK